MLHFLCHLGSVVFHNNESVVVHQALHDCGFVQLNHPAYSPDPGPSDYFAFRNPKLRICGTRSTDVESRKVTVEAWFDRQNGKIFFQCVNNVEEKWKKCTDVA